jgi:hypothetical protein
MTTPVILSEVEGSRGESLKITWRDPSTSLGMTALSYRTTK